MTQHRNPSSTSITKVRSGFKSPLSHDVLDIKSLQQKYSKKVQQLTLQRQRSFYLQQVIQQMRIKLQKQQRQLLKKQQIQDVLLIQINQLKQQVQSKSNKSTNTLSKQNSIEEKISMNTLHKRYSEPSWEHYLSSKNSSMTQMDGQAFTFNQDRQVFHTNQHTDYNQHKQYRQHNEYIIDCQQEYKNRKNQNVSSSYANNLSYTNKNNQSSRNQSCNQENNPKTKSQIGGYFGSIFNK